MPMTYSIDQEARLVRIKGEGLITDDEMVACVVALREDPDLEVDMNTLSDMRNIEVGFTSEGINKMLAVMARSADKRSMAKAAIVASSDVAFGMGRMFEAKSDLEHQDPLFHVFRDMDKALEWLGLAAGT